MKPKVTRVALVTAAVLLLSVLAAVLWADDLTQKRSCDHCGMDRKMYGYSRALIRFADGSQVGTCSLNCAVIELDREKLRHVQALLVADRDSRSLIDAATAIWVMGGDKSGVMTRRPKWAFADKVSAEAFVKDHGGEVVDWDAVLRAAREDAYEARQQQ
jgi:copper chaperone NosL